MWLHIVSILISSPEIGPSLGMSWHLGKRLSIVLSPEYVIIIYYQKINPYQSQSQLLLPETKEKEKERERESQEKERRRRRDRF